MGGVILKLGLFWELGECFEGMKGSNDAFVATYGMLQLSDGYEGSDRLTLSGRPDWHAA
jgi:hypothetical protein